MLLNEKMSWNFAAYVFVGCAQMSCHGMQVYNCKQQIYICLAMELQVYSCKQQIYTHTKTILVCSLSAVTQTAVSQLTTWMARFYNTTLHLRIIAQ